MPEHSGFQVSSLLCSPSIRTETPIAEAGGERCTLEATLAGEKIARIVALYLLRCCDATMVTYYQWTPLPSERRTRVIQVEPADEFEEMVHCQIINVSIDEPAKYKTMSYAWGPTSDDGSHLSETIMCDGFSMRITSNLDMALKRMRQDRGPWYWKLPLWVWLEKYPINISLG